jgi:HEAT repeat protein
MKALHNLVWHRRALRMLHVVVWCAAFCATVAAQAVEEQPPQDDWFTVYFVDGYGLLIVFLLAGAALLVFRKLRSGGGGDPFLAKAAPRVVVETQPAPVAAENRKAASGAATREGEAREPRERRATPREPAPDLSHQAFGAYRIDQEVGKLVLGKAHRMDVLSSRVPEDRRAIEASLIKSLTSGDSENEGRERARRALEDYGFVARQSALLLEGRDAWERSSAARVLGQIGSSSSLSSLIEALHDGDSIVRNQAVSSLGQLKQPAAIGALLDVGRRYPDIPPSVLTESLSACYVEGLGFIDTAPFDLNEPMDGNSSSGLEPLPSWETLPSGDENDALLGLLTRLESSDSAERAQVARELGMHRAERSVSALCAAALHDADTGVRSAAVTAMGVIDHESVFAPVLIALADDTREVRAAAARALSSLHFDRAQAYARVEKTADSETLHTFAQAAVKTGIAGQAADRLASEDRRQAHEAYSLFSLLAKAGELQPVFDVIENHSDLRAKQVAVRVLTAFATADAVPKLRDIVGLPQMAEDVRTGLLEVLYKLDNTPAVV